MKSVKLKIKLELKTSGGLHYTLSIFYSGLQTRRKDDSTKQHKVWVAAHRTEVFSHCRGQYRECPYLSVQVSVGLSGQTEHQKARYVLSQHQDTGNRHALSLPNQVHLGIRPKARGRDRVRSQ